jgi:hypothetical protein
MRIGYFGKSITYKIKLLYQKITRGYSNDEVWDFGIAMCKWIVPRLTHLIHNHYGFPSEFEKLGDVNGDKAYTDVLKEMLWFVKLLIRDDWKEMDENKERMRKAEKLCVKYMFYLWD